MSDEMRSRFREKLKCLLWERWGDPHHPAEWDGNNYGGGRGSQRFWEYLWAIDPAMPSYRQGDGWYAETLAQFLHTRHDMLRHFDVVTCLSVLEHLDDKPAFCRSLDRLRARIVLTFELAYTADLVTMATLYSCLAEFQTHYITKLEVCPVWADNSDFGRWRPCGVVLEPFDA